MNSAKVYFPGVWFDVTDVMVQIWMGLLINVPWLLFMPLKSTLFFRNKWFYSCYNHGHDILRLLMFDQIFLSPQVTQSILGNWKISGKS